MMDYAFLLRDYAIRPQYKTAVNALNGAADEIDRLRAELAECKGIITEAEHLAQDEAYERAACVCDARVLRYRFETDIYADQHVAEAKIIGEEIRALKSKPPALADHNTVDNYRSSDEG